MTQESKVSTSRLVVAALLTGEALKSRDVAQMVSHVSGRNIQTGQVSSILSRISNPEKCSLGRFIQKTKQGNAQIYCLVKEATALSEEIAYGLTLKIGANRYDLDQALKEYPKLEKYIKKPKIGVKVIKKLANTVGQRRFFALKSEPRVKQQSRSMELSIRYSSQYAISVTTSFTTFVLMCCAVALTFGICCFFAYTFFFSVLVFGAAAIIALFLWQAKIKKRAKS